MPKRVLCVIIALFALGLASCGTIIPEKESFTLGTVENNVYENELGNIRFAPGPSWTFNTEEGFILMNSLDPKVAGDRDAIVKALADHSTLYDMTAEDERNGYSVAVTFENMTLYVGSEKTTVGEYIEKLKAELSKTYEAYGVSFEDGGKTSIAEEEYDSLKVSLTVGDAGIEQYYYIRKIGGFFMSISVSSPSGSDAVSVLIPVFEKIDADK